MAPLAVIDLIDGFFADRGIGGFRIAVISDDVAIARPSGNIVTWKAESISLDTIDHFGAKRLAELGAHGDDLMGLAARLRIPKRDTNEIVIEADAVLVKRSGTGLYVARNLVGRDVADREDLNYGRLIRAQILETCVKGATAYKIGCQYKDGHVDDYARVAVADRHRRHVLTFPYQYKVSDRFFVRGNATTDSPRHPRTPARNRPSRARAG